MAELSIRVEDTPNPNARRYIVNRAVQEQPKGRFFTSAESDDPVVRVLFELDGVAGVMLLPSSVTVNKKQGQAWDELDPGVRAALESHLADRDLLGDA